MSRHVSIQYGAEPVLKAGLTKRMTAFWETVRHCQPSVANGLSQILHVWCPHREGAYLTTNAFSELGQLLGN